jgi:hypothetical protein
MAEVIVVCLFDIQELKFARPDHGVSPLQARYILETAIDPTLIVIANIQNPETSLAVTVNSDFSLLKSQTED